LVESSDIKITCTAIPNSPDNVFSVKENAVTISTFALSVDWNETRFNALKYFDGGKVETSAQITIGVDRIYDLYFDD
jgi:hypothetical protein